jgi:hypothetical protein
MGVGAMGSALANGGATTATGAVFGWGATGSAAARAVGAGGLPDGMTGLPQETQKRVPGWFDAPQRVQRSVVGGSPVGGPKGG